MTRKISGLIIVGLLIIVNVLFISLSSQQVSAVQGLPTVNIALTETSKVAHVAPGETGVVTFSGVVTVSLNQMTRVVVSLTATDTWGTAVVDPSSLLFDSNSDQPFSVSVRAPQGTPFTHTGSVIVTGTWTMYPGGISGKANPPQGAEGRIDIAQYFKFSLDCENITYEVMPGGVIQCELRIQNQGNYIDIFGVELLNENDITSRGIELTLTQSNIEIPEFSTKTVPIIVDVPDDNNKLGNYELRVKVWSVKGQQDGIPPQEVTFEVTVTNKPRSGSGSGSDGQGGDVGDSTTDQKDSGLDWGMFSSNIGIILIIILVVVIISLISIIRRLMYRSKKRRRGVYINY